MNVEKNFFDYEMNLSDDPENENLLRFEKSFDTLTIIEKRKLEKDLEQKSKIRITNVMLEQISEISYNSEINTKFEKSSFLSILFVILLVTGAIYAFATNKYVVGGILAGISAVIIIGCFIIKNRTTVEKECGLEIFDKKGDSLYSRKLDLNEEDALKIIEFIKRK